MTPLTPEEQAIKDIGAEILALQRRLYDSPLRNRQLRKVMGFSATVELADKIAIAAAEAGMTRSQWLRELVTNSFNIPLPAKRQATNQVVKLAERPLGAQTKGSELLEF